MVDEQLVWPEQLQSEPSISTWPDMPSIRPLPAVTDVAWPDLIAAARGHQSSRGGSGSLSARKQRWPTAAEPLPDLDLASRGVGRRSSTAASFGRRASAPATLGSRLSDEIARFATGLLREEHVQQLDSIRGEMRPAERAIPCCDRCGDFTCALARPPPSEVVRLTLATSSDQGGGVQCLDDLGLRLRRQHGRLAVEWVADVGVAAAAGLLVGDVLLGAAGASPLPRDASLAAVEAALLPRPARGGAAAGEALPEALPEVLPEVLPGALPATVRELAPVSTARDGSRGDGSSKDGSRAAPRAHELPDSSGRPPSPPP